MPGPFKIRKRLKKVASKIRNTSSEGENALSPTATIRVGEREQEVPTGITILQAVLSMDLDLDHYCGGHCSCGSCRVEVCEGANKLSKHRPDERMVLGAEADARGDRLACQARILGDVSIKIPDFFML